MKSCFFIVVLGLALCSCNSMKMLNDSVYIHQRTPVNPALSQVDSLLIVANGNSATQRIMEDVIPMFRESLKEKGVNSSLVFVSYTDHRIDEFGFDRRNYKYTLWIYEQDRKMQQLDDYEYLVPLAMKITDNQSDEIVWIATSIFNDIIRKKFYKERYAGTLVLLLKANGFIN